MMRQALLFACLVSAIAADSAFDCHPTIDGQQYDLSWFSVQRVEGSVSTPPSITKNQYQIALCQPIPHDSSLSDADQCPAGTRVCLTEVNSRDNQDRIIQVIPLAGEIGHGNLEAQVSLGSQPDSNNPAPLVIKFDGGDYAGKPQTAEITLVCDAEAQEIKTIDHHYSASSGTFNVTFASKHVCGAASDPDSGTPPSDPDPESPPDNKEPNQKKGWGFFSTLFYLALIGFVAYFVIGAYIQRTQYSASGWDLVPHRDFWRDLPFVVRDMVSSRSRGGYNSLQ